MNDSTSVASSSGQASSLPNIQSSEEGSEHFVEDNQASSQSGPRRKPCSARRTIDERLDLVFNFLRNEVHWTLSDLF